MIIDPTPIVNGASALAAVFAVLTALALIGDLIERGRPS